MCVCQLMPPAVHTNVRLFSFSAPIVSQIAVALEKGLCVLVACDSGKTVQRTHTTCTLRVLRFEFQHFPNSQNRIPKIPRISEFSKIPQKMNLRRLIFQNLPCHKSNTTRRNTFCTTIKLNNQKVHRERKDRFSQYLLCFYISQHSAVQI